MTQDRTKTYDSFVENAAAPGKGESDGRLTVDMARSIVAEMVERRDRMPRSKKKSDEDEIDALVDDLDDEVEDEDEDVEDVEEDDDEDEEEDEDDEDPDEAPKRSRRGRKKSTAKKAKKSEKAGVGTVEVAEAAGVEPRQLRMYLRSREIQSGETREGRYHWPSLESKEVQRIIKDIRKGAVDRLNKEKIANLKGKKSTKKTTAKKRTKVRSQKK